MMPGLAEVIQGGAGQVKKRTQAAHVRSFGLMRLRIRLREKDSSRFRNTEQR